MRKAFLRSILVAVVAAAIATPTLAAPPQWPSSVDSMVTQARAGIPTIDMAAYLKVVKDPKGALILDVREADEFAAGHVPGAVNVPRGLLEWGIWQPMGYPNVNYTRTIYVQCFSGGRASLAARTLKTLGFKNPVVVLMTWTDWVKAGNPVAK